MMRSCRPSKNRFLVALGPIPFRAETVISEATKLLTFCCLRVKLRPVMTMVRDAFQALEHNLRHECKRLDEVRHEMEKLASSYNRYIELRQELEGRYVRITRILGLLGPEGMEIATHNDHDETIDYAIGGQFDPKELRKNLVLWQAIEQFLYCVSKASVEDIQAFLDKVGITDVSRQAIESAVKAHSKVFRVIKKGKEKYLALRESSV